MRQRKPKNLEEKLRAQGDYLVADAEAARGRWRSLFDLGIAGLGECQEPVPGAERPRLYLELGTGKGAFIAAKAKADPEGLYLGIEAREAVILRAAEKAKGLGLKNLLFSNLHASDLRTLFAPGELDGLFLNFSDPWPKARHSRRRLTSRAYLDMYDEILRDGAFVEFKTDDEAFFKFTEEELRGMGSFAISSRLLGLHEGKDAEALAESGVPLSEYEERFIRWKRRIYYLAAVKVAQYGGVSR